MQYLTLFNLPNFISLLRIPLAFVFLQENPLYRALAIVCALASDGLDGYVARRFRLNTQFGTLLDPFTDKFFVIAACLTMIHEHRLTLAEACMLICRDFSVVVFGCYLIFRGRLAKYRFRAILCGKITTVLQFIVLFGLALHISFPPFVYLMFIVLGVLALVELYFTRHPT
jgi:phosphatidylglycerophosphate synthase